MMVYLLTFLFLTGFALVLTSDNLRHLLAQPWKLMLRACLMAYFLVLFGYGVLSCIGTGLVAELHVSGPYTVNDLYVYALWVFLSSLFCLATGLYTQLHRTPRRICFPAGTAAVMAVSSLLFFMAFALNTYGQANIRISEVCSRNSGAYANETGLYHDYIELYNPAPFSVSAKGLYLTDDLEDAKSPLDSDISIPAKGYAIVWADGNQLDFRLGKDGETLYLLSAGQQVLDSVDLPALDPDTAYARNALTLEWEVQDTTPMAVNAAQGKKTIPLTFSHQGGFYAEAFTLTLTAPEGCHIYYTLDSSTPDAASILYTQPIGIQNVCSVPNIYRATQRVVKDWANYTPNDELVDKAMIVRAIAIDENGNTSNVITNSYFVGMEQYREKTVLSLVSDPEGLFGEDGIYVTGSEYDAWYLGGQEGEEPNVNFRGHGMAFEREASAELFSGDQRLMSQPIGLRLQGSSNRYNVMKRLSLYARPKFSGSRYFSAKPFGRNTHSMFTREDFADVIANQLIADTGIGGLDAVPVEVFLDGEFWYSCYLRERYDETYVAEKFSVSEEGVELGKVVPEEIYTFLENHSLSEPENYQALGQIMDIQNYAKFLASNIYLCNLDTSEVKNLRVWRAPGYSGLGLDDGRWRFLLYDADFFAWGSTLSRFGSHSYALNTFSVPRPATYSAPNYNSDPLFAALKENPQFCQMFVLTFMDLANTCFEREYVAQVLAEFGYDRTWNNSFFDLRFDYIVPFMAQEFGLSGTPEQIILAANDSHMGCIQINSVTPDISKGTWTGSYYTDYPVTITAQPSQGYEFVAWRHGEERYFDSTLEVSLEPGENLWEAEFQKTK